MSQSPPVPADTRPGGFEIRRKKKGSTYENGGFVIPL